MTVILLLSVQIAIMLLFIYWLDPHLQYIFGGFTVLSVIFDIYLINQNEKPEFKIAWIIPVTIFPLFGILLYFFTKLNVGNYGLRVNLEETKRESARYLKTDSDVEENLRHWPQVMDLSYYLQNSAGNPTYMNTEISYYPCGEQFFEDLKIELEQARHFIFLEFFIIGLGFVWNTILAILVKKAAEGVEVRVMWDGIGSLFLLPSGYTSYLASLGIQAQIHTPLKPVLTTSQNNRDHRKIIVIDGETAFTGGLNLSDEYMNYTHPYGYWKDTAVKMHGSSCKSFTAMFLQLWNLDKSGEDWDRYLVAPYADPEIFYSPKKKSASNYPSYKGGFAIPYCDDAVNNKDIAEHVYFDILSKARWYVHITTPYTVLDDELVDLLIYTARRGVDVTILVPCKADHFITFCIGRTYIKTLVDNGVHVYEYLPGFIHSKMFISDGERAVVGSINLDYRSLYHHFESAVFIYGNSVIKDIERDFKKTQAECREITSALYKKSPVFHRAVGRVFRIFAPLF
jgi:cardiolipin synthase